MFRNSEIVLWTYWHQPFSSCPYITIVYLLYTIKKSNIRRPNYVFKGVSKKPLQLRLLKTSTTRRCQDQKDDNVICKNNEKKTLLIRKQLTSLQYDFIQFYLLGLNGLNRPAFFHIFPSSMCLFVYSIDITNYLHILELKKLTTKTNLVSLFHLLLNFDVSEQKRITFKCKND